MNCKISKFQFFSLNLIFLWIKVIKIKQSGPYKIVLNRKFSTALQEVELPPPPAQDGAILMIPFLYCSIIALLETFFNI